MIDPSQVSAVLVTRGDVDMSQIIDSIHSAGITDVVLWDNSQRDEDVSCYGRYLGIAEALNDVILHIDDDLVPPVADLLRCYDPVRDRYVMVSNNRIDEEWPLTGIGSLFHRDLADCFGPYIERYGKDGDFYRCCDVVFAYQQAIRRVVLGYQDLPWHSAPNSMYLAHDHMEVRLRARHRVFELMREGL